MNLKKMLSCVVIAILFTTFMLTQSMVYAATLPSGQEVKMGITELMKDGMGYGIYNPQVGEGGVTIWDILKYKSQNSSEYGDEIIYCVKAGIGFTQVQNGVYQRTANYNVFYDMKKERNLIKAQNDILKALVEGTVPGENGTTVNRYDAILAVLDASYLPGESTELEKKQLIDAVIQKAKDPNSSYNQFVELLVLAFDGNYDPYGSSNDLSQYNLTNFALTDSDIKAIQQAAIWYFTNYGEDNGKYDQLGKKGWLNYTTDGTTYTGLRSYVVSGEKIGEARAIQAEMLYQYIIEQAKANASKYTNISTTVGTPATLDTKTLGYTTSGDNYIVGPIHITENSSSIPYTVDLKVKNNGTEISNYTLLDQNQTPANGVDVKSLMKNNLYISIPKDQATALTIGVGINYNDTTMTLWASSKNNQEQPLVEVKKGPTNNYVELKLNPEEKEFDLALRKYITKVNGVELTGETSRIPNIDESTLTSGTTASYKHKKDPVAVITGDKVTYKMTIYNEGEKAGRATKVVDQLPEGLTFDRVVSGNFEKESYDTTTNRLILKRKVDNTTNLPAYAAGNLASETIEIECTVTGKAHTENSKILTNVAWISEEIDEDNTVITNQENKDRDSEPATTPSVNKDNMENYTGNNNKDSLADSNYYYKGQQDDDDFEKLVMLPEAFDLKLIKRITAVNNQNVTERIKGIDASKLNTLDENGKMITTAEYDLDKNPVSVKQGDIVTYTFRIYNEGTIDGYAQEITEDVPKGLQFLWSAKEGEELQEDTTLTEEEKEAIAFNQQYLWGKFVYDEAKENIIQISSDYLSKENETTVGGNLIKAFGKNDGTKTQEDLSYKEIAVKFKVIAEDVSGSIIRNEAAITEDCDKDGDPVDDRDSQTDQWVKYEDDEDYDQVILQSFDLALRKFIIAVSRDEKIEKEEELREEDGSYTRAPVVDTSKLNTIGEDGKMITTAIYNHTKQPVRVSKNDIVVYMLRVYNEGEIDGYAAEIKDHLPPHLEFVEGDYNKKYGWEVSEDGRTVTTKYLENSLIKAAKQFTFIGGLGADKTSYELSYKEVPIMCRVKDTAIRNEKITNIADITKYLDDHKEPVRDRDSQENNVVLPSDAELPSYKDNETGAYIPGQQDDDDFEKLVLVEFDLALRKWVTQAIVIENGKQTVTNTGHQPYDDPEQVVKVELNRKKLNQVTVKFKYSIRVINEGDIAGYAKEVTDYVPQGLKFIAEDNPGWTDEGNNVISTTLLANRLLQPGEYADVEVVLTWINDQDNLGLKTNVAEISKDENEYGVPDRDSTPDNKKYGEDDIDDAPVMLSVSTGQVRIYFTLGFVVLITIAGGVVLIKKFVL